MENFLKHDGQVPSPFSVSWTEQNRTEKNKKETTKRSKHDKNDRRMKKRRKSTYFFFSKVGKCKRKERKHVTHLINSSTALNGGEISTALFGENSSTQADDFTLASRAFRPLL